MKKESKRESTEGISLPRTSTSDLRGRQSVRATFKLTAGCIDAISIVARQLGIKQKSLFDHLVEDTRSLSLFARTMQKTQISRKNRIQKTFVISRKSLSSLDKVSRSYNAPRDALVEFSAQSLLPIIEKEQEKHNQRKEVLDNIAEHFFNGEKLLNSIEDALGIDDEIYQRLSSVMSMYENAYNHIASYIEKGKIIEDFQIEKLRKMFPDDWD